MEVSGYNLSWRTFSSHLAELSRELYQEKYFSDVTLVSEDLIAVEAHRMVLSAASPVLRNVLRINPTVRTQLFLKGIKHQQLDSVLKFIYHGEVQVPSREINNFLKAGRELEITELCNIVQKPEEDNKENKSEEVERTVVKDETLAEELNVINFENISENENISQFSDLPSWDGEPLFPPHNKASSKSWKLGGFRKRNGILEKSHTVCGVCGKEIKYRHTPTNLQQHLQNNHPVQWTQLE